MASKSLAAILAVPQSNYWEMPYLRTLDENQHVIRYLLKRETLFYHLRSWHDMLGGSIIKMVLSLSDIRGVRRIVVFNGSYSRLGRRWTDLGLEENGLRTDDVEAERL